MINANQIESSNADSTPSEDRAPQDAPLTVEVPSEVRAGLRFVPTAESDCWSGSSCYS
jgi:hypothetical protein